MHRVEQQIANAIRSGEVPDKIGTILPYAKIKYIDENTGRWVTVDTCIDAPKPIGEAVKHARQLHKGKTLWVHHVYGKEIAHLS